MQTNFYYDGSFYRMFQLPFLLSWSMTAENIMPYNAP